MEDFLSMDNILSGDEAANLFLDEIEKQETPEPAEENQEEEQATEVNPDELFDDEEELEEPESVGSVEKSQGKKDTTSNEDGSSPNNFYSSIASALKEEGIFPDLDDETIEKVVEPEDFRDLVDRQIQAGLQEAQKRIYSALNAGVQPNVIQQYEQTLGYLNSITEDHINDESDQGENLRRNLLQQDFINRGYSQERAVRMTEKLFSSGEDIEEAKQALIANKEYFAGKYNAILDEAKRRDDLDKAATKKQAEQLKKDILQNEKIFGDIPIDKNTRKKVYDNIAKPVYRDPDTGQYYTALLKYRMENLNDFIKNVGILFTLTDGFSNIEKLVKPSAKKEVKQKLKELEHKLNNTSRDGGNMKLIGTTGTFFDKDFAIDLT